MMASANVSIEPAGMSLRQSIMLYMQVVHASEPVTILQAILKEVSDARLSDVRSELDRMARNGTLVRTEVPLEYRMHDSEYCYWLPRYCRPTTE